MKMEKVVSKIIACAIVAVITITGLISPEIKILVSNLIVNAENVPLASDIDIMTKTSLEVPIEKGMSDDGTMWIFAAKEYEMDDSDQAISKTYSVKVVLYGNEGNNFDEVLRVSVYVDDMLTNLAGMPVGSTIAGDSASQEQRGNVDNYFAITGLEAISITSYGSKVSYYYNPSDNSFIEYSTAPEDKKEVIEETLYNTFFDEYAAASNFISDFTDITYIEINNVPTALIKVEDTNKITVDIYQVTVDEIRLISSVTKGGMGSTVSYKHFTYCGYKFMAAFLKTASDADFTSYISIFKCEDDGKLNATNINGNKINVCYYGDTGDGTFDWLGDRDLTLEGCFSNNSESITLDYADYNNNVFKTLDYVYDEEGNIFIEADNSSNEADGFTIEIPYEYFVVVDSVTGEEITKPGANKSMVNAEVTECTNGIVKSMNTGCDVCSLDRYLESITVENVKPGKLTIDGTCQSYTSIYEDHRNAGYTCFGNAGDGIEDLFTLTVIVDENGSYTAEGEPNENYDTYYITSHQENKLEEEGLWYSCYLKASSSNELYKVAKLIEFDAQYGTLYSNYMLDKQKALFDLDLYALHDAPFDSETYCRLALSQLITEIYSQEEMTTAIADALADVLESAFESNDEIENIKTLSKLMEGVGIKCDTASSIIELLNIIRKIDDAEIIDKLLGSIGKSVSISNFIVGELKDKSILIEDVYQYIQYTVYYKAFLYANEEVKDVFLLLEENTADEALHNVLSEYIDILDTENTNSYISKLVLSYIVDKGVGSVQATLSKIGGEALNYFISEIAGNINPYFRIWQGARLVVTIENTVIDSLMETEQLYHNVALFATYDKVHKALYKSYEGVFPEFSRSNSLEDAKVLHLLQQCYKFVDIMAIESANDYLPLFIRNNSMMHGLSLSLWIKDILGCEITEVFSELQQLYYELDDLEEAYIECNCCMSEEHWKEHVAAVQYVKEVIHDKIDSAVEMTSDALLNWYEKKKSELNEWYQCAMDVILIACPVTVNVYDAEGNLIAVLSDNGVETSSYYNRFFITCNETEDEVTEDKSIDSYDVLETKAKILLLPHESSDFRYEIIGDTDGKMDVYTYEIESINAENWFDQNRQKISCQNIPIREKEIFAVEKAGSRLVLKNLTSGEVYESTDSNSTNFVLIVIIGGVIVAAAVTIVTVITVLVRRKKKYSSNSTVHNTSQHRFKYCRKCGEPAKYESSYCKKCGTQFIK